LGRISDSDKAIIDSVLEFYGAFSKEELIELTQSEPPWREARKDVASGESSWNPLSQSTAKAFYALQKFQSDSVPVRPKVRNSK